ncbi:MAG: hypothetical protein LBU51_00920 [Bacteroidales bacterium]|jgi:hypothetical protein|nr:hypothetical protein [Bacteroidales bacterium]
MKKLTNLLFVLVTILLFSACDKDPVTYRFEKEDEAKLLPHYTVGKILTFKNEVGEERKFEVSEITRKIRQDWENVGMGGVSDHYYFFYETKEIYIMDSSSHFKFAIVFWQYPINKNKAQLNVHKTYKSLFMGHIVRGNSETLFPLDFEQNQYVMNVNGVNYKNVIKSKRTDLSSIYFLEITEISYDIYQGLIEFNDKNNHQWKLINE